MGYNARLLSVDFFVARIVEFNKYVIMKVIELLKISTEALKLMSQNGILLEDYKYVEAYEHFLRMRLFGIKYRAAISMLAEEWHVGERTLQRAFARLSKEC